MEPVSYADLLTEGFAERCAPSDVEVIVFEDVAGVAHENGVWRCLPSLGVYPPRPVPLAEAVAVNRCPHCLPDLAPLLAAHTLIVAVADIPGDPDESAVRRDASARRPYVAPSFAAWLPDDQPITSLLTPGAPWIVALLRRLERTGRHPGLGACRVLDRAVVRTDRPDQTIVVIPDELYWEAIDANMELAVFDNGPPPPAEALDLVGTLFDDGSRMQVAAETAFAILSGD